jgi:hypothetical protein
MGTRKAGLARREKRICLPDSAVRLGLAQAFNCHLYKRKRCEELQRIFDTAGHAERNALGLATKGGEEMPDFRRNFFLCWSRYGVPNLAAEQAAKLATQPV